MISGKQTLGSIDDTLQQQRDKIESVEQRIEALGQRLVSLQAQQLKDYRALAEHRVDDIADGLLLGHIDATEREVESLLRQRQGAMDALVAAIDNANRRRPQLELERSTEADALEALAERIDAAEADAQQQLEGDPAYPAQRERAERARHIAEQAREKASRSQSERIEKGKDYESDALFMYLFKRHYGTSEYHANGLAKSLDGWVAGLVRYGDARANYQRLLEIPERLDQHATAREQHAVTDLQALQQLEAAALQAHGTSQLEVEEAQLQSALDAIDTRIDENEAAYQVLLADREQFAAGADESYRAIVQFLSSQFANDDLRELREDAFSTPGPEDDIIVARLIDAENEKADITRQSRELQASMAQHRNRLRELERARKEFKRRRYDHPRSGFSDGALVGVVLGELLNGALKSESLWDTLERQQRPRTRRSRPDFGSGGFGRGTMWGGDAPRSAPPRRGGFGGGGFSTGGGFGGGSDDFRTGGGF